MRAKEILDSYFKFFKKQGHKQIANSPLVPENDPTTLFTSSGMQPLVPYLLGEVHPQGKRLVNVQNSFRAVDIDEVGDDRHTTFFRMLGNWSLGDYFKKEEIAWFYEFLTKELHLDPKHLYITIFRGDGEIPKDEESFKIWQRLLEDAGLSSKERVFEYGVEKNWWSRSGTLDKMPAGEPGGPDTEVFYDFGQEHNIHEKSKFNKQKCHVNCECGRHWEIGNSVFMQYQKQNGGSFKPLPKQNVDFGGGLERLIGATENQPDMFQTSLFAPTIKTIEKLTRQSYIDNKSSMQIITDHLGASSFIIAASVTPSNKEQGYILRRLIRRGFDHFSKLGGWNLSPIVETIVQQYKDTDPSLVEKFEHIKLTIIEEVRKYSLSLEKAKAYIVKKYNTKSVIARKYDEAIPYSTGLPRRSFLAPRNDKNKKIGDELMGVKEISAEDAFYLYASHGLSPTQIESLGYTFDKQMFAEKMEEHQKLSRKGAEQKFRGGLANHQEKTIMGHTATHLLHQALRDLLGKQIHQTGSNITVERVRFDFNYDRKLTEEQIKQLEDAVKQKIKENLPVHFELIPTEEAHKIGAIGLFMDMYGEKSKIYFIGGDSKQPKRAYSIEFCGGPHVDFTAALKSFKIIKQENIGNKQRRIYAVVG